MLTLWFKQVTNTEIYYRAIQFYLQEHPLLLNDLLLELAGVLDHSRVVNVIRQVNHLPLIQVRDTLLRNAPATL